MGGLDKPLLDLNGHPLLARVIAALRPQVTVIAISANGDPARFAPFGLPVLRDELAGQGPLAGVAAGLDWAAGLGADALLTVPGDTPFIPTELAAALHPPPACAVSAGRVHHLVALWPVTSRPLLQAILTTPGSRAVARASDQIGMRRVEFPAAPCDPFFNVNTPADLARARRRAREGAT